MDTMKTIANVINGIAGAPPEGDGGGTAVVSLFVVCDDSMPLFDRVGNTESAVVDCTSEGIAEVADAFTADESAGFTAIAKYEKPGVSAL
jgi:hypothetical protein